MTRAVIPFLNEQSGAIDSAAYVRYQGAQAAYHLADQGRFLVQLAVSVPRLGLPPAADVGTPIDTLLAYLGEPTRRRVTAAGSQVLIYDSIDGHDIKFLVADGVVVWVLWRFVNTD